MMDWPFTFLITTLGVSIGVVSGLLGVGGGLLIVPALYYIPPLLPTPIAIPLAVATGFGATQSLAAGGASARGHYRHGSMHLGLVGALGIFSMAGSYLGALSAHWYEEIVVQWILVGSLVFAIVMTLRKKQKPQGPHPVTATLEFPADYDGDAPEAQPDPADTSLEEFRLPFSPKGLCFSLLAGVAGYISGMLGIGGAIFMVPMMVGLMHIPMRQAIATSAGIVCLIAIVSFLGKIQGGLIWFPDVLWLTAGAIVGGTLGAKLSPKVPVPILKSLFIGLLAMALIRTLCDVMQII